MDRRIIATFSLVLIFLLTLTRSGVDGTKKKPLFYKKFYKPYYKLNWPKIHGRCSIIPLWNWNDTRQPVLEAAAKEHVSVLFLTKGSSKYCMELLQPLNELASYYRKTMQNVTFIALSYRLKKIPDKIKSLYPYINFYEEPAQSRIFVQLNAGAGQYMIFDKCGRQQYHIGYPFSSFQYQFLEHGITNSLHHHTALCGKCNAVGSMIVPSLLQNTSLQLSGTTSTMSVSQDISL